MNSLGWIDFSQKDRDLARDIIASLNVPGAIDELGIGVIRDRFADLFFPGTSTLQTLAKYFFLVAYQVEKLTATALGSTVKALFAMEQECSRRMWEALSDEQRRSGNSGVFGSSFFARSDRDWVKRPPSEVYWNGVRKLHFLVCSGEDISLADFLRRASAERGTNFGSEADEADSIRGKSWHWDLPPVDQRGDWERRPTIDLTPGEARWLVKKIRQEHAGTMFAFLIEQRDRLAQIENFPDIGSLALPEPLRQLWQSAKQFSDFMEAAQIRFNCLLHNESADKQWAVCEPQLKTLAEKVDLDSLFVLLDLHSDAHKDLRAFLKNLHRRYLEGNIAELDRLIRHRERSKKGSRAKIGKDDEYYRDHWVGGLGLQYRFPNARRIVSDILKAEGKIYG